MEDFEKLPSNSRVLLGEIVESENPVQMLESRFNNCTGKEDSYLRGMLKELIDRKYIKIFWADNVPHYIEIHNSARTYAEREAEYERCISASPKYAITYEVKDSQYVQIQNNTNRSVQKMTIGQVIDFEKAAEIFRQIVANQDSLNLSSEEKEKLVKIVGEALPKAEAKTDEDIVKKALITVRDVLTGASGSLIATGVLQWIAQMGG